MCGSGTFLIEAALMASNTAPGLSRPAWPFQQWPDFDARAWGAAAAHAAQQRRPWSGSALGNDDHEGALSLAARCAWTESVRRRPLSSAAQICCLRLRQVFPTGLWDRCPNLFQCPMHAS